MILHPTDIHDDSDKARLGVVSAARALGINCDCRLATMWRVDINGNEREIFIELAREEIK